ncbi:MAG: hypothetical protein K0S33_241 [Bacteroidetes bacterium]|jgi:hypothetical protein|nr:hypothetical protein [Bacteroidota bacterium]
MKTLLLSLGLLCCLLGRAQNGFTTYSCTLTGTNPAFLNKSCVAVDNAGNKWVGFKRANTSGMALIKFDGANWTNYTSSINAPVLSLAADAIGNLWIGTVNAGLIKFDGSTFTSYKRSNSTIISDTITAVAVINNMVYAGSNIGFSEFNGTAFNNFTTSNSGISSNVVYCFEQENSQVWIGTTNGLNFLNGGTISYTGITNRINDIMVDGSGNKWLGTETAGLIKYDNSTFSPLALPVIVGGNIPVRIGSIGKSMNNNPVVNTEESLPVPQKNGLVEILPGNAYRFFPHSYTLAGECIFASDNTGVLYFTDWKAQTTPTGSMPKKVLYSFQQNQYNAASAISSILPENTAFLDINEVSAGCNPNSDIHWDGTKSLYEVPKGSGSKPTFASAFWIGGYINGTLHTAANTYRQTGNDFWPGPINTFTGTADTATAQQFNRVWKVSRLDVENFKYHFLMGNVQNGTYPIPNNILTWPGDGSQFGEMLAPYFDYNNNFYYDPQNGDYPLIKGDQMLWWVFNDALAAHTETGSTGKLNVQVQVSAYAYTCPSIADADKVINYTTFYNYKIINKNTSAINNMYVGIRSDVDLGNYQDDYIGCDVMNNFGFVYNGDTYDDDVNGVTGYHANTPYFSYSVLRGPAADAGDGIDNDKDGCIDCTWQLDMNGDPNMGVSPIDESTQPEYTSLSNFGLSNNNSGPLDGNPSNTGGGIEYYNYLSGRWRTGAAMHYDQDQATTNAGPICSYIFPGTSDPLGYGVGGGPGNTIFMPNWTELLSGTANTPGDRRMHAGSGKFTMDPMEITELDFAYVFTQDNVALGNGTLYNRVVSDNQKIKKWFTLNNAPSCLDLSGIGLKDTDHKLQMLVFPNPASNSLTIDAGDNNTILKLKVYDILGKEMLVQENIRTTRAQLNIASLNAGVYLLEVQSEQGAYFTKFIKQ